MKEVVKFPADQMLISMSELKEQGFTPYKIRKLVDAGVLNKLNKKYYENPAYTDERFNTGICNVYVGKNRFRIYDLEKTVVDIVYYREKIGNEEMKEVLINYLKRDDRDLNRLTRYAEKLKCGNALKTYLEVLV